ncbi:MAG: sugar ABC transporter permease [Pygmaiobacter sp.]|nr:sugar ABC transporter permease [Pygmaiobacter sp.]
MKQVGRHIKTAGVAWLLLCPWLLGVAVFWLAPSAILLYRSLFAGAGAGPFVGLQNYRAVLGSSSFRLAACNTLLFLIIAIPCLLVISFLFAQAINKRLSGSRVFQSVLLSPLVLPAVGIVTVIQVFFGDSGFLNRLLSHLGRGPVYWLDTPTVFWIVVAVYIWKNMGYTTVLLMVGINGIPKELYRMADMDGAGAGDTLRHITLPLLVPTGFFTTLLSIINSFKIYREVLLLGGIHPAPYIYFLQHYLYNNFNNLDYAAIAVSTVLFVAATACFLWLFYSLQKRFAP